MVDERAQPRDRDAASAGVSGLVEAARRADEADECPIGNGDGSGISAAEILKIVEEIQAFEGTREERREHFRKTRKEFRDACPTLFDMACKPGLDMRMLAFMLRTRDSVGAGEENGWAADKIVGSRLAGRYLPASAKAGEPKFASRRENSAS
jgi:hypothetical protein